MNGIYAIVHRPTKLIYVGKTYRDFSIRLGVHKSCLRNGTHGNHRLQALFNAGPDDFAWTVLCTPPPRFPDENSVWISWYRFREHFFNLLLGAQLSPMQPFEKTEALVCRVKRMLAARPAAAAALSRLVNDPYCSAWLPLSMTRLRQRRKQTGDR